MEPIKSSATSLYVQKYPGGPYIYLGDQDKRCFTLDGLPNPRGGLDPIYCIGNNGEIIVTGTSNTGRDLASWTVEELLYSAASELDLIADQNCPFVFHAAQNCQSPGVFAAWERVSSYHGVKMTGDDGMSNVAEREGAAPIAKPREMTALSPRYDAWRITVGQKTTTETNDANTIHSFVLEGCGDCGPQKERCDELIIGCDASGAATAKILRSVDGGNVWAATAADPFAGVTEDITAARMFLVGATTIRFLATRSTDAGNPGEVSYSDDSGATWTEVAYGSTNGEYVAGHRGMMVIGETYIWIVTSAGNAYFSSDGGLTWAVQSSALVASGANQLNAVHFPTTKFGVAVGAADTVIYTQDGGENWAAASATGGGVALNCVYAFSVYRWIVGDAAGDFYQTWDGGATWTKMTQYSDAGTGSITDLWFETPLHGYATHVLAGGTGYIIETVNGGYSWDRLQGSNGSAGLNALHLCGINKAFAVGDDDGTRAVILGAGR